MSIEIINPRNSTDFYIAPSQIHGMGMFARKPLKKNDILGIAIYHPTIDTFKITKLARYVNHSKTNYNVKLQYYNGAYYLITTKNIPYKGEILANYDGKDVPNFIAKSKPHYK